MYQKGNDEIPRACERSLQILDLRWYLFCGVDIQSDMLEKYIDSVPEDYREIIRERLDRWFSIPRQHRTNILANVKNFPFPRQAQGSVGQGGGGGMMEFTDRYQALGIPYPDPETT